ncbi:mast cell carboxypeptidase A-like [Ambystoma mexicanum]|uniref:mast cell carboxypeptidase A-like n=1 Tax=Ambystoma mexicanum TaxID=8296 RepID=UPI0037E9401F
MQLALLLLCGFISIAVALPSGKRFDGDQVFHVKPLDEDQVNLIKKLARTIQIDFWRPDSADLIVAQRDVYFRVSAGHIETARELLEQNAAHYEILFQDVQHAIENQFSSKWQGSKRKHGYNRYNDWETILAWTEDMADKYPKLISRIQIGTTIENRPIYILKVGKQNSVKKAILMDCGIHAREWVSPAFCQWFVKEAVKTYGIDKKMTKLLDGLTFYVIPVLNADGYVFSWTQDRMWRKNRSENPNSTCIGTDLNRNFAKGWELESSNDECSEIYPGARPESELEIQAVTAFIRDNIHSLKGYISVHAFSQLLLIPYGYTFDPAPNNDELMEIAKNAVDALYTLHHTNFTYGPIATTIYECGGSSIDWIYEEGVKYSFAFELRDTGKYGFLLPENRIKPTCKETMLAVNYIASYILKQSA